MEPGEAGSVLVVVPIVSNAMPLPDSATRAITNPHSLTVYAKVNCKKRQQLKMRIFLTQSFCVHVFLVEKTPQRPAQPQPPQYTPQKV